MTSQQMTAATAIVQTARSLFNRGYSFGTAGNLSVRAGDHILVSPTNSSFESLEESTISLLDSNGSHVAGDKPSKEAHFHLAIYETRPDVNAVVHLHSTYATAVSCLPHSDSNDALPVYTPYFAMRIPCLPVVPFLRPGHPGLADGVRAAARLSPAMLLKNHGPITAGRDLREASALAEELEEQSKLYFLLQGRGELLTAAQLAELRTAPSRSRLRTAREQAAGRFAERTLVTAGRLLFAAVADDDTGASDLAGMFADQGVPVVLVLDVSADDDLHQWTRGAQGVVFATAARALPRELAVARTLASFDCAKSLDPRCYLLKYCSTFDSTEEGNIGPTLDAALATLGESFTIALPALPVNGRTTYCGYHFVSGQLLSDSPMRLHPLNPMTNPNLVDFLARQTSRPIGLTSFQDVSRGPAAISARWAQLREQGVQVSIVDCLDDHNAAAICEAACELRLLSGGSAFGTHMPAAWRRRGWLLGESADPLARMQISPGSGRLAVAGSCSVATTKQNAWLAANGAEVITVDAIALVDNGPASGPETLAAALSNDATVLLKTDSSNEALARSREWSAAHNLTPQQFGLRLAEALAALAADAVKLAPPRVLISAGGETSSALCRALGVRALAVGRNIQPGVPLCVPLSGRATPLVLKSGNFGSEDFYGAAFQAAERAAAV